MTPLYIFDLDGTLADLKHRRHHVERPECRQCGSPAKCVACSRWKPNWNAFHAACVDDTPIAPVIRTMELLVLGNAEVWIWSGRMDTVREQTHAWFEKHLGNVDDFIKYKMRPAGDFTSDDVLKESWLHAMSPEDRARLVIVFDDRDRVVNMWRRNGVVCAQVAPGDF